MVLSLKLQGTKVQFYYGYRDEEALREIGPCTDASFLSDEACREGWFTGSMTGICCQDLTGFGKYADFDGSGCRPSQTPCLVCREAPGYILKKVREAILRKTGGLSELNYDKCVMPRRNAALEGDTLAKF